MEKDLCQLIISPGFFPFTLMLMQDSLKTRTMLMSQNPDQILPGAASKFIVFGGYSLAVISQQGHDTCFLACLSAPVWLCSGFLELERIKWAGLLPQTWGGEEKKEEDHKAKDIAWSHGSDGWRLTMRIKVTFLTSPKFLVALLNNDIV